MSVGEPAAALAVDRTRWTLAVAACDLQRQTLARPVTSPVDKLIEPFIVGRSDGRLEIASKVHRMLANWVIPVRCEGR